MQVARHTVENAIAGKPCPASSGKMLHNIDPATGAVIGTLPRSGADDVAAAVAAAKDALPTWSGLDVAERCRILDRIAHGIEARFEELAHLESQDTGKPLATSTKLDIPRAVQNFRFYADFVRDYRDDDFPMQAGSNRVHRKPVGVVGLITPWNLPLYLLSWKVAPALAMGNTIVAKPSEMTPQTASALAAIAKDAGLPDGALNVVHGLGPEAGAALVGHPDVRAISFTGGTASGRAVAQAAAPGLKKLSLELGGKNATIIFADIDLDVAVAGAVRAGFTNTGQVCLCGSRILVDAAIEAAFTKRLIAAVEDLRLGDPMDPTTCLGPLVSHAHRDKVESYLHVAKNEGATVHGGRRPRLPGDLAHGAFLEPAIITDVAQASPCVQEEIFGPVVTVQSFCDESEAIGLANDVPYGLAASVWSADRARAHRVADALDTGMVWINEWLVRDLRVPFGGMKQSGVGREGGRWSLEFFSEARNVYESGARHTTGHSKPGIGA